MSLDPDAVRRWKSETIGAYIRLFELDGRAQDNGMTDDERAEYERLKAFTNRRLVEFLRETR